MYRFEPVFEPISRRKATRFRSKLAIWPALVLGIQLSCFVTGTAQEQSTAPRREPSSTLIDRARNLIQHGDPQGALSLLQNADADASDAGDVHTLRGICFAMTARPIESSAEFDQAIALRPNYAPAYLSAGLAAASFNNLDRATQMLSKALRLEPQLPGLRYNYAMVLARSAKYMESEKQVDLLLAGAGHGGVPVLDLLKLKARDAYYQKNWQDAADSYEKVLKLQPDWAEAYARIGEALYSLNQPGESETALRKALALDPEDGAAHQTLGKLYQDDGKQDLAIAEYESAIRLRPGDREAIYRLFRIYSAKGDKADAARLQKQLKDLVASNLADSNNESKAIVLNNKGIDLERKGQLAAALESYDQAAAADVSNIVFRRNAALLLCKMGRTQEALQRLHDILSMDPDDAETLQILAVANELASGNRRTTETFPQPQK